MVHSKISNAGYGLLLGKIGEIIVDARRKVVQAIDTSQVFAYWHIGMVIVEYEQKGKDRAEYGEVLLKKLSADMTTKFGRGFSRSNLQNMRLFYLTYPKCQTLSGEFKPKLSWSHYCELLKEDNLNARAFRETFT